MNTSPKTTAEIVQAAKAQGQFFPHGFIGCGAQDDRIVIIASDDGDALQAVIPIRPDSALALAQMLLEHFARLTGHEEPRVPCEKRRGLGAETASCDAENAHGDRCADKPSR